MNTREEFEKWMCDNYNYTPLLTNVDRELAFKAWQEQQKKIDELQLKLDIKDDAMLAYQLVIDDLKKKIAIKEQIINGLTNIIGV